MAHALTPMPENKVDILSAVELRAAHIDFGGFSGAVIKKDGSKLYAVTDRARMLEAVPVADPKGGLSCLKDVTMRPVRGKDGEPLAGSYLDAEGLTFIDKREKNVYIGFERRHRVTEYDLTAESLTPLRNVPVPDIHNELTYNESYEAVRVLRDGTKLFFPEYLPLADKPSILRGYYQAAGAKKWKQILINQQKEGRYITDIAELRNGDIVTLERSFAVVAGPDIILRRFGRKHFLSGEPSAGEIIFRADREHGADNLEAMATLPSADGDLIYLMSDNNFLGFQKNLLITLRYPAIDSL